MARYIRITKTSESNESCEYAFGPTESVSGLLRIEKGTGIVTVIREVDQDSGRLYSPYAERKVWLHWRDGEYPDNTCWAS